MPIYAYKCQSCGHAKDVLQKISDDPLTNCPKCAKPAFTKQVTAAGFQLKGSGWYVTDFREGGKNTAASQATSDKSSGDGDAASKKESDAQDSAISKSDTASTASATSAAPTATPAPASTTTSTSTSGAST